MSDIMEARAGDDSRHLHAIKLADALIALLIAKDAKEKNDAND